MIVASSRSRERKKDDKVAHGGGILHLGQQSQIIYTPTHGHMELMGIDQAGEFPPGTLASSGLGQQIIILAEENTAKGVRAIKQFRVAEAGGAVVLGRQQIDFPQPERVGDAPPHMYVHVERQAQRRARRASRSRRAGWPGVRARRASTCSNRRAMSASSSA